MKIRKSNVIAKARALKVKCFKILQEQALSGDPTACALIISLAENSLDDDEGFQNEVC